jgi:hypothetical protein
VADHLAVAAALPVRADQHSNQRYLFVCINKGNI